MVLYQLEKAISSLIDDTMVYSCKWHCTQQVSKVAAQETGSANQAKLLILSELADLAD